MDDLLTTEESSDDEYNPEVEDTEEEEEDEEEENEDKREEEMVMKDKPTDGRLELVRHILFSFNKLTIIRPLQFNILFLGLASPQDRVGRPACK